MAKKNVNFSIEVSVMNDFKKIADDNAINMSKYIENCIIEFIKKNIKNNDTSM